ncbi:MAG: hypothetical protein LQ344_005292 [Seirophora lacunosa]|nr:MAG: hypothetical protein LQ344_005292 [Seirophora lacunosa]
MDFISLLSFVLLLLLRVTSAQLTATITSPDGKYLVDVTVSNPTAHTIAILNWNNLFDPIRRLSPAIIVRDARGFRVPMPTTYVMRAGMRESDFCRLAPGANFSRGYDLRARVRGGPDVLRGNITVGLPDGFKGIASADRWMAPVAAIATRVKGNSPTFGDYEAAGLQDITLRSRRLHLHLGNAVLGDNRTGFQDDAGDGIHVDPRDCLPSDERINMHNALEGASTYANALALAADDPSNRLFANYFHPSGRETVRKVAAALQTAFKEQGPRVTAYCTDDANLCDTNPHVLGHSATESRLGDTQVMLCPDALKLPEAPSPCSSHPRREIGATASRVILHLLLTLNTVVGGTLTGNVYGSGACQLLKNSHIFPTLRNPDSYAQLAIAQYTYGFGGPPYSGPRCPPKLGIVPRIQ